jgi:hypothetical protein
MGERDATIGIPVTTGLGRNASEEAGYYGTYWVKHLNEINVIDDIFDGFWMKSAYRIPDTPCNCVEPGTAPKATIPINRCTVRSFITNVAGGAKLKAGNTRLKGIAFDVAAASRTSPSRSMGARAGCQPGSARILANTRSASGRYR